jgi:hypothetical protein
LERTYSHALQKGELLLCWKKVIISVIFKALKDPQNAPHTGQLHFCKISSSILAKHLEAVITTIIHPDQIVFIPGCHQPDNIRRLLNIMSHPIPQLVPRMVLALDAETVSSKHLKNVIQWIQSLYSLYSATQGIVRAFLSLSGWNKDVGKVSFSRHSCLL